MATLVRSYSKVNLGLAIGAARADGFHSLVTLYQTLALYDLITVSARPARETRIRIRTNDARVPTDARNTVWKMVERVLDTLGRTAQVTVHIEKRLPIQGGMGAGSANAAAALMGLERELGLKIAEKTRLEMAAAVGSDVPLFLVGGAVIGVNRGERVKAAPAVTVDGSGEIWCVIALPGHGVSTPQAFRDWDARMAGREGPVKREAGPSASPRDDNERARNDDKVAKNDDNMANNDSQGGRWVEGEAGPSALPRDDNEVATNGGRLAVEDEEAGGEGGWDLHDASVRGTIEKLSRTYASVFGLSEMPQDLLSGASGIFPEPSSAISPDGEPARNSPENLQGTSSEQLHPGTISESAGQRGGIKDDLAENTLLALVRTGIENDFETVVFPQYPSLREIKRQLMGFSDDGNAALYAALSGSGSALFGLYRSEADANAAQQRLAQLRTAEPGLQQHGVEALVTKTLPRPLYWSEMFAE